MFYAQLNGSNVCVAVTQSAGSLNGSQFVPISSLDITLLGKTWNGSSWS